LKEGGKLSDKMEEAGKKKEEAVVAGANAPVAIDPGRFYTLENRVNELSTYLQALDARVTEMARLNTLPKDDRPMASSLVIKLIGAAGIYAAFGYYGLLQEDLGKEAGKLVFFVQALEAACNVVVGLLLVLAFGGGFGLPLSNIALSGASQLSAKACTALALKFNVSFPVVTLAKSGKMIPVMIGAILLTGQKYTLTEYMAVLAIIAGTCIVSMDSNKKHGGDSSSIYGLGFIALSLACDGLTGGMQDVIKKTYAKDKPKGKEMLPPFGLMLWTNLFMCIYALIISAVPWQGEKSQLEEGLVLVNSNPALFEKILKFGACSAIGQSFIFFLISNISPLFCTTVTTTRKIFSVLVSIFVNGHALSTRGYGGIAIASAGILSELLLDKKPKHGSSKKNV